MNKILSQGFRALLLSLVAFSATAFAPAADAAETGKGLKVLVFWASWCPNCGAVLKNLDQLRAKHAGKNVEFCAVSFSDEADPKAALHKKGVDGFKVVANGEALFKKVGGAGFPWVVIVDDAGHLVAQPSATAAQARNVSDNVSLELNLRGM